MKLLSKAGYLWVVILLNAFLSVHASAQDYGAITDSVARPNNSKTDAMYFDGVKAEMLGDYKLAASLFGNFIELEPDEPAAYYELSRLDIQAHEDDKAEAHIKKAIELDGNNKWYKDQYAAVLIEENKYAEAAEIMEQLAGSEQDNEGYLVNAASLYQRAGNYKKALEELDKLIAKSGQQEELLYQKQQIYMKMNDFDNAAKVINQLIAQNPKEGRYYMLLGEQYDHNKEPEKAVEVYEKAEKILPGDPSLQLAWAEHYREINDSANYAVYEAKAITNPDMDADTQLGLLSQYIQSLNSDSLRRVIGLQLITKLVVQHPDNAIALSFYGDMLSFNNEHGKAMEQYKKSITIDPSVFDVWRQLLINYTNRQDADSLVKYSEKAMRLFPNQVMVYYLHGVGEMNLKNYIPAIKSLNRAIDMQPEDNPQQLAEMYSILGDIYNILKQYNLSDSCYTKSLQYDPNNATVLNNYAYYLSERGSRLGDAEKMSKQALALRPDEATFLDTYGWILYKGGKYDDAKGYIQKAIDADPQNADATLFNHLGDIYYKLNDKDKAVQYWQKAKEKGDDDPQIEKKIQERKLYD